MRLGKIDLRLAGESKDDLDYSNGMVETFGKPFV